MKYFLRNSPEKRYFITTTTVIASGRWQSITESTKPNRRASTERLNKTDKAKRCFPVFEILSENSHHHHHHHHHHTHHHTFKLFLFTSGIGPPISVKVIMYVGHLQFLMCSFLRLITTIF
ncbi:hypothetical protein K7X08_008041 [Anisodus acutangulus]|uniref:Uncharacterized protein n=1 Tax=Anisodus acutangulus TaxID=402998 RepID=A0A9Q1MT69_9SOLA|nr:hypothetical protein K7X08_008041 [Anisodus acutangulus]